MNVLDVAENSMRAQAANVTIRIVEDSAADILSISIEDDGCGMDPEFLARVTNPFTTTRTTRKVGMGIPLLKAGCEATGGTFEITSEKGVGTKLVGSYVLSHLDRPPLGDYAGTAHMLIVCNPDIDFYVEASTDADTFVLDTQEVREQLGGEVPLNAPEVSVWLSEYLAEGIQELNLNE